VTPDEHEIDRLQAENERLSRALNAAAGTGLVMYHVAKGHPGLTQECPDIGCGLQRRTMEDFVGGEIAWDD
jgi:hypothetical protein